MLLAIIMDSLGRRVSTNIEMSLLDVAGGVESSPATLLLSGFYVTTGPTLQDSLIFFFKFPSPRVRLLEVRWPADVGCSETKRMQLSDRHRKDGRTRPDDCENAKKRTNSGVLRPKWFGRSVVCGNSLPGAATGCQAHFPAVGTSVRRLLLLKRRLERLQGCDTLPRFERVRRGGTSARSSGRGRTRPAIPGVFERFAIRFEQLQDREQFGIRLLVGDRVLFAQPGELVLDLRFLLR